MTVSKHIFINCDGGSVELCVGDAYGADSVGYYTRAVDLRKDAHDDGWHYSKDKDYCPACWKKLKEQSNDNL